MDLENNAAAANFASQLKPSQQSSGALTGPECPAPLGTSQASLAAEHRQLHPTGAHTREVHQQKPPHQQQLVSSMLDSQLKPCNKSQLQQATSREGRHAQAPRGWTQPSERMLPRAGIFYCNSFCAVPGLPKQSEHAPEAVTTHQSPSRPLMQ